MSNVDEKESYLEERDENVIGYYKHFSKHYIAWIAKRSYYYRRKVKILQHLLPQPGRILEVGCGIGQNLVGLKPEYGVGIDISEEMIDEARKIYPESENPGIHFKHLSALKCSELNETFDTIVLSNSMTEVSDLLILFRELQQVARPDTRIVLLEHNYLYLPFIDVATRLRLAPKHPVQHWLTKTDMTNLWDLCGLSIVRQGYDLIVPFNIPLLSNFANRYLPMMPFLSAFCALYYGVLRFDHLPMPKQEFSVTVCVPCKDEEGNIDDIVSRIPEMGSGIEIIFVDDKSTDATADLVRKNIEKYPDKNIKLVDGPGQGKGAACRAGFSVAENDILMILDADMTVMPEALPEFYRAIISNSGEFINGSRLVYQIENQAMRFANIIGNKMFAVLFTFILGQPIKDTLCGTKVIWRRDYSKIMESREVFGDIDQWGDYDWIFGAARHNLAIVDLPVHYRERVAGETKMSKRLQNAWIMLRMSCAAFKKLRLN